MKPGNLRQSLLACLVLISMSIEAQQIDSLSESILPYIANGRPQENVGVNIFVSDTTKTDSIIIKLGYEQGGTEMFSGTFSVNPSLVLFNSSGLPYYHIDIGIFDLYPPFIEACLVRQDRTLSLVQAKQLLY